MSNHMANMVVTDILILSIFPLLGSLLLFGMAMFGSSLHASPKLRFTYLIPAAMFVANLVCIEWSFFAIPEPNHHQALHFYLGLAFGGLPLFWCVYFMEIALWTMRNRRNGRFSNKRWLWVGLMPFLAAGWFAVFIADFALTTNHELLASKWDFYDTAQALWRVKAHVRKQRASSQKLDISNAVQKEEIDGLELDPKTGAVIDAYSGNVVEILLTDNPLGEASTIKLHNVDRFTCHQLLFLLRGEGPEGFTSASTPMGTSSLIRRAENDGGESGGSRPWEKDAKDDAKTCEPPEGHPLMDLAIGGL